MTFYDLMQWIKPPFLDEDGNWKDTSTEANPEGDWPWVGDQFLAAVETKDGYEYAVVAFSESGLELDGEPWGWLAEDVAWVAKIITPPERE